MISLRVKEHPGLPDLPEQALTDQPEQEYCSYCIQPFLQPYQRHGYGIQLPEYSRLLHPGC